MPYISKNEDTGTDYAKCSLKTLRVTVNKDIGLYIERLYKTKIIIRTVLWNLILV